RSPKSFGLLSAAVMRVGLGMLAGMGGKYEIRNSKNETNPKFETLKFVIFRMAANPRPNESLSVEKREGGNGRRNGQSICSYREDGNAMTGDAGFVSRAQNSCARVSERRRAMR